MVIVDPRTVPVIDKMPDPGAITFVMPWPVIAPLDMS